MKNFIKLISICSIFCCAIEWANGAANQTFAIDYENNQFLKDGKGFRFISGDFEYFKIPAALWKDRFTKYKAAGLNAVQTYIAWNLHEPESGEYNFEGDLDFVAFFKLAQEMGFVVILRPGPFINAELDMGGLPYWLLSVNTNMKLRTNDTQYMAKVERWLSVLMPKIKPQLYNNGGPVIMVQVENEYAYWSSCDLNYINKLHDWFRGYLGNDTILYSTDGIWNFKCSIYTDIFPTIDFGTKDDPKQHFSALRQHLPKGPLVNSEFYPGWINRWELSAETVSTQKFTDALDVLLAMNASVNIYPFCGGTMFGFTAGASHQHETDYHPVVTSYDFDGPLNENGDPTEKYFATRNVIGKYVTLPTMDLPVASTKMELPAITLKPIASVFDEQIATANIYTEYPHTYEQLGIREGFVLYSHIVSSTTPSENLTVNGLGDRAQVFVDKQYRGTLSLTHLKFQLTLTGVKQGSRLDILVENQGRYAFRDINQLKGIAQNVTLGQNVLKYWNHSLIFRDWKKSVNSLEARTVTIKAAERIPSFFSGTFQLPNETGLPHDSFLRLDGWGKGVAILNGFNLGRYWPLAGPQLTLYAPFHLFKQYPQQNILTVFELEKNPCVTNASECVVKFVKQHVLNATANNDI